MKSCLRSAKGLVLRSVARSFSGKFWQTMVFFAGNFSAIDGVAVTTPLTEAAVRASAARTRPATGRRIRGEIQILCRICFGTSSWTS